MKFSESWLREWVDTALSSDALTERLTMAGLEVDSIEPAAAPFSKIVVGQVLTREKHPNADKLSCCTVDVGGTAPLAIVCGAKNVAAGQHVPVATVGAVLGGDFKIKKSKLRGEPSEGMICSEKELGLAESSDGIMVLPEDAPIGEDVRVYLNLDDNLIDIDLTPNRGDCLSIAGIAREVAALTGDNLTPLEIGVVPNTHENIFPVEVLSDAACPRYVGRVIEGITPNQVSPLWLQEKLRRCGLRSIDPVVDVTNYVMLELGQPMHAFDLETLRGKVTVRQAKPDESITLLNGDEKSLNPSTLVIADEQSVLAIAGLMGGLHSAVTTETTSVFLEAAYFSADAIAGKSREYNVFTDSSFRFERGVDFNVQAQAMERATALLLEIVGGEAGPVIELASPNALPSLPEIYLRHARLQKILGVTLSFDAVTKLLEALQFQLETVEGGWKIKPASNRFDLRIEEDLIEEVARAFGYDNIPAVMPVMPLALDQKAIEANLPALAKNQLAAIGYSEVVTYSFVDSQLQALFAFDGKPLALSNPISSEMDVMRVSLWPGLVQTLQSNLHRGVTSARFFEYGMCFADQDDDLFQQNCLAGLVYGSQAPEQWAEKARKVDFYDLKADVHSLCAALGVQVTFEATDYPGLHPGQSSYILQDDKPIGVLGLLHPQIAQTLKLSGVYVFSMNIDAMSVPNRVRFEALSKFQAVSRDIAFLLDSSIPAAEVKAFIQAQAGEQLKRCFVFDIYEGEGVPAGSKSLALRLVLQSQDETLQEEQINSIMENVISGLTEKFDAKLRD